MAFHLIPHIQLCASGPESYQARQWRPVQLTQGSLDGACGPYSIIMLLLVIGLMCWDEVTSYGFWFDPKHSKGRLWGMLEKSPGLMRDGTELEQLHKLLRKSFGAEIRCTTHVGDPGNLLAFIITDLREGKPVIAGLKYSGGGHWLVLIGYEEDNQGNVVKLLALDSSADATQLCPWNAYVEVGCPVKHRRYKYSWVNASRSVSVKLEDALSVTKVCR